MGLEEAIAATERMCELLAEEIARAGAERGQVCRLDAEGLFSWATARQSFQVQLAARQEELARALQEVAARYRLPEVTLARILEVDPELGRRLSDRLEEVRRLAAELRQADDLNRTIVERALACVRGYTEALAPTAVAYDRRGHAIAGPASITRYRSL